MNATTRSLGIHANEEAMYPRFGYLTRFIDENLCGREDDCRLFRPCDECGTCSRFVPDDHDLCENYEPYQPDYYPEYEHFSYELDCEPELLDAPIAQN